MYQRQMTKIGLSDALMVRTGSSPLPFLLILLLRACFHASAPDRIYPDMFFLIVICNM